jgi:ParB family chromosome partitioning protein
MVDETSRNRLGRGLAALLGEADPGLDAPVVAAGDGVRRLPIEFVRPNPANPRRLFAEGSLEELTESVREKGILQPIIVRRSPGLPDAYEIIAGERRWRAAQRAGLAEVPALIVSATDQESLEFAIIENVQRADLNALEEARGYERLVQTFGYTQADVAKVVGKSRSHVTNTLRLLALPEKVRERLETGQISAGHARALLAVDDAERLADRIVAEGLTVRDVERFGAGGDAMKPRSAKPQKDVDTVALEKALGDVLGLTVSIDHRGPKGKLVIQYRTLEQLDEVCRRLQR